jgi:hypothetical protein
MTADDPIGDSLQNAKTGFEVIGQVIKAAGDNPEVKAAGKNLGQTALTVTKTINNVLMPLALINYGFEKARVYFSTKFEKDMAEKTADIPPEYLVEPKASIAGPALQGLAFTHEEPDLKEMYLNLLKNAMDGRSSSIAHPAFVEIIRQLSSEEVTVLPVFLKGSGMNTIVEVRSEIPMKDGWMPIRKHLLNLTLNGIPEDMPKIPMMVDNWIRLGLVNVDYKSIANPPSEYDWIQTRPELLELRKSLQQGHALTFAKGVIVRTAFGGDFATAVGL